jgi:hypothetical protein
LLLAGAVGLAGAPAAGAAQSAPIGVSGNLRFGPPGNGAPTQDVALVQLTGVTATVDDFGNFTVPAGVAIGSETNPPPGVSNTLLDGPIDGVRVVAQSPLSGSIDAGTMTMTLSGQLAYTFVLGSFECTTQLQNVSFISTSLDPATETATLVPDGGFSVPTTIRGPSCPADQDSFLEGSLQLPTAPNMAELTLSLSLATNGTPTTPPPSTDPGTTPPRATPPGSTGAAVLGSTAAPKSSSKSSTAKASSSKSSTSTGSKSKSGASATTATDETTTTAFQYGDGVTPRVAEKLRESPPNAVAAPAAPQSTSRISDTGGTHFGVGVIALIVGGLLGAVYLLRSEGRRLFRRRDHAAF